MSDDYFNNDPDGDQFGIDESQPRQRSSTNWGLIIGIFAGVGLLGILACCGIGWYLMQFGTNMMTEQVKAELKDNAVIQEQIGTIESISIDYTKIAATDGKSLVFRIEGDKGSGHVAIDAEQSPPGPITLDTGTLQMDSGETFDLSPEDVPAAEDVEEAPEEADEAPEETDMTDERPEGTDA